MSWDLTYTKQAQKDAKKLASSNLRDKAQTLLDILTIDPFETPPPYENWWLILKEPIQCQLTFNIV